MLEIDSTTRRTMHLGPQLEQAYTQRPANEARRPGYKELLFSNVGNLK
jgi:hypothetical protein